MGLASRRGVIVTRRPNGIESAWESRRRYHVLALSPVAIAVRADEQQKLVGIESAKRGMHDGTIAEIGGRRRDEVADPRTSRFEFWQEPLRLPSPRGLVCIHGLQPPGASDYPCKKRLVASLPVAVSRRVIRLLR